MAGTGCDTRDVHAGTFALSAFLLVYLPDRSCNLFDFYALNMRTPLFTGFLTIGAFLLTLKTFIIVKLKEGLYDSKAYQDRLKTMRNLNPDLSSYGPLARLSKFLIYCVLSALITSVFQFSVGFIKSNLASALCISLAATIVVIFFAWWQIQSILSTWFELLEEADKNERQSRD